MWFVASQNQKLKFYLLWILDTPIRLEPWSPKSIFPWERILLAFQRDLDHENRVRNVFLVTFLVSRCFFKNDLMKKLFKKRHRLTKNVTKNTHLTRFSWSRSRWKARRIGFQGKIILGLHGSSLIGVSKIQKILKFQFLILRGYKSHLYGLSRKKTWFLYHFWFLCEVWFQSEQQ